VQFARIEARLEDRIDALLALDAVQPGESPLTITAAK
jgi:hypothetical protein